MKARKKKKLYLRYLEGEQRKLAGKRYKKKKVVEDADRWQEW